MKKRVAALVIALGCLIGFLTVFVELTEFDPFLRRTVLRAAPPQLRERLRPWCAPLVINSSPEQGQSDVLPRSPITLTFLTPMNPSTVERNISFIGHQPSALSRQPPLSGQFSWPDERTCVFTPAQPWPAGAEITVTVGRGARSWLLRRMAEPFTLHFTVLASPIVVDPDPSRQARYIHNPDHIAITFSHLMDEASVESHLSIKPPIRNLNLSWAAETLTISGDFRPGTTYQVTISQGARDAAYGLPMTEDFAWAFTVVERQPNLAVAGRVGMVEAEAAFQLPLATLNLSRVDLALYTLDSSAFVALQSLPAKDWEQYRPEGSSLREWSISAQAQADRETSQKVEVDPLPPGLYLLTASAPERARTGQLLSVSRSALVLKRAPQQVLVWVVALADGSPAADYEVTIYGKDGRVLVTGQTDREGVFRSPLPEGTGPVLAVVQQEDDVAVCAEEWSTAAAPEIVEGTPESNTILHPPSSILYIYTDRPIYRPGQEVRFKAIVRHDDDGHHSLLPPDTMVPVTVTDEAGRTVYQETLQITPFGSVSGSFPLSEEAAAGRYRLVVGVGDEEHETHFQVERPRRPGYAVSVATDRPGYVKGDAITVTISADYDFGVPVAGAEVSYTLYAAGGKQTVVSGRGMTDDEGRFTVALPTATESVTDSQLLTLKATVTAPGQPPVSASTSFPVYQGSFYISLRPERRVARTGQKVAFDVRTIDTEGQPQGQVRLSYTLDLVEWHRKGNNEGWEEESLEVTRGSLRTDEEGRARITFKPTTGGVYRLRVEGQDRRGNRLASSTQLWVSEAGRRAGWRWPEGDRLELITDKVRYRVGEVAEVMVLSPYRRATALLTVERGRVMTYRTVELEGYSNIVSVPVEPEYFPNAFVSIVLIPGHHPDGEPPGFKIGYAELTVESAEKKLTVTLSPDKESYQPGERVVCAMRTADGEGQPLSAEVSLTVVDGASSERPGISSSQIAPAGFAIRRPGGGLQTHREQKWRPGIIEVFYGRRGLAVRTAESLAVHLDREGLRRPELVEGARGIENPATGESLSPPRQPAASPLSAPSAPPPSSVVEVAYWNPAVVTGEDGRAKVAFHLPRGLTTWRVLAQGMTADTRVGTAAVDLVVSQDLSVRLISPPFLRMGDQPVLGGLLHNHTDKPLETTAALTATGLELRDLLSRTVVISAGSTARVDWPATVSQESTATMTLSATGEAAADEAEWTVPILPFGDEGGLTDAGGVEDEIALTVSVPKKAVTAALTIKGFPSLLALTVDSLDYLRGYPYGNTEQTASWLLAVASVRQALGELDREDEALRQAQGEALRQAQDEALSQELAQQGQTALWRLYRFQGDDGGWGWWENTEPSPYLTAQVVHSLIRAKKADFPVDEVVLERGVRALQDYRKGAEDPNLRAYLLYVLTKAGKSSPALADSLPELQAELAPWARACWAMTTYTLGRADEASGLAADLAREARVTVGTAHWPERKAADELMAGEMSTTALALQALLQIAPDSPLIPKALDWLIRVQQDGHWRTPRETAAVVAALTDYLVIKGERTPDHHYQVLVNGQVVGSGDSTGENMALPVRFVVTNLVEGDNEVRLVKEGKERLHYALTLRYYWGQEDLESARSLGGPSLHREYFDPATGEPRVEYRLGDLIGVRLTVRVPEEMWYVVVEDPLPAGVKAIEGSLQAEPTPKNPVHFEGREEKVALFIQRVEAGEHVYSYLVRAAVPGRFRAMPALVYPAYEPNLWGRSAGGSLEVTSLTFKPK